MIDKIKKLVSLCNASVNIEINPHRDYYQTIEQYLYNEHKNGGNDGEMEHLDVLPGMIEADTMVRIQFYPTTPVGFYVVYHHDIEKALDECIEIAEQYK